MLISGYLFPISEGKGNDGPEIISKKVDFIIEVATGIKFEESGNNKTYKIGIYGRGSEANAIYEELILRSVDLRVGKKSVQVYAFKRIKQVEEVDLVYLSANSKLRISDLHERLGDNPFNIITENFPFGTSTLNIMIDDDGELNYEIQDKILSSRGAIISDDLLTNKKRVTSEKKWRGKFRDALEVIESNEVIIDQQEEQIKENNQIIRTNKKQIAENNETINSQSEEIKKYEDVTKYQRNLLLVSLISIVLIMGLLAVLLVVNKERKSMIVQLGKKNKHIMDSIHYAEHIQGAMLPALKLMRAHLGDYFILFKPKDFVSGDFYWFEVSGNKLFFSVADCTGHGVPGAIMSALCSTALSKTINELKIYDPAKILDQTVDILEENFAKSKKEIYDGMDLALCCVDLEQRTLTYAGANNSLIYFNDNGLNIIKADRQSIGRSNARKPYSSHRLSLDEVEFIYMMSDGYPDQFGGEHDKKFTKKRFRNLLTSLQGEGMEKQGEVLESTIEEWIGKGEQTDDICVMGVDLKDLRPMDS